MDLEKKAAVLTPFPEDTILYVGSLLRSNPAYRILDLIYWRACTVDNILDALPNDSRINRQNLPKILGEFNEKGYVSVGKTGNCVIREKGTKYCESLGEAMKYERQLRDEMRVEYPPRESLTFIRDELASLHRQLLDILSEFNGMIEKYEPTTDTES